MKLLNKNVEKQRPTVSSLREKAENIAKANPDSKVANDVKQILRQFDSLAETIEVRAAIVVIPKLVEYFFREIFAFISQATLPPKSRNSLSTCFRTLHK